MPQKAATTKKYKIRYCYESGDSDQQYPPEVCTLEPTWTSVEAAAENLERIKQHYGYVNRHGDKAWHEQHGVKVITHEQARTMPWYSDAGSYSIVLKADNGNPITIAAPWCGHFESLEWAEVIEHVHPLPRVEFGW